MEKGIKTEQYNGSMKRGFVMTEIILNGKYYEEMLFSRDGEYVSVFIRGEEDGVFVKGAEVMIKRGDFVSNAQDYICNLTDLELQKFKLFDSDGEQTWLATVEEM